MNEYLQRGYLALQSRHAAEAVEWFDKAIAADPKNSEALAGLGQSLCRLGRRAEGLPRLRQAGQLLLKKARKQRGLEDALQLARQLQHWHDYRGALALAGQMLSLDKTDARIHQVLALSHASLNRPKDALQAGRQALRLAPDNTLLHIGQAAQEAADGQHDAARRRLEKLLQRDLPAEEKYRVHKELARACDALEIHDRVFPHLRAAAAIAGEVPAIRMQDADLVPRTVALNRAGFSSALLDRCSSGAFPEEPPAPIFLIGFMRSGTTLTQAVLGAHPDVFVADEAGFIAATAEELTRMSGAAAAGIPQCLEKLDAAGIRQLRAFYRERVRQYYGDAIRGKRLVDKTTMNTLDTGLIRCLFPDAKLVFVLRDPRDVCLSCSLQTMVPTPATVHLLDWRGTAAFYALVMQWWADIRPHLGGSVFEFRYEDAVTDFTGTFQGLFRFLSLPWDPAVADFHHHAAGRFVASPSRSQVARPLYRSAIARWKTYEAEFATVAETLAPFVEAYGYAS